MSVFLVLKIVNDLSFVSAHKSIKKYLDFKHEYIKVFACLIEKVYCIESNSQAERPDFIKSSFSIFK